MSLFGRIAVTAVALFVVGGLLGLFVWRPSSRAARFRLPTASDSRIVVLLTRTSSIIRLGTRSMSN